jgi:cytoskeletal protein CcmA (bactofilin family)
MESPEAGKDPAAAADQNAAGEGEVIDATPKPADTLEDNKTSSDPDSLDGQVVNALTDSLDSDDEPKRKKKKIKRNIYVILFIVLFLGAGGVTVMSIMSSQKKGPVATIGNQALSPNDLAEIANSDANVGSSAQTLTVQSSTIFSGPVLVKGSLTAAGNFQTGGTLQAPNLVISGTANLPDTQIKTLQVQDKTVIQGPTSLKDLNVSGSSNFSGPIIASQITVTKLILSGNASLQVPNHIAFTGATPGRTVNGATFGAGGSANIGGSDTSGSININTGAGPVAGCFMQVTFNQPYSSMPRIIVSPFGAAAGSLDYYVTKSTTGFSLCTNNAAAPNSVFGFDYFVMN